MNINVVLLYTFYLSPIPASICPSIPFKCSHPSFLLTQLLSHHFHCYFCFSLLYSDIFKPSPWGEQKRASIWNQLFCSVHESRTKPWQKNSCKDRCVICLCPSYRLWCYQSIYCAAVLQLWMRGEPRSTSKLSQIWSRGQMARNAVGTNKISTKLLIRTRF